VYTSCPGWPFGGGGVRALQSNINICYSPQPAAPHLKLKICWVAARPEHENGHWTAPIITVCTIPQMASTISFRHQVYYGLLPARPGYMVCWVESLCMLVSVCHTPHSWPHPTIWPNRMPHTAVEPYSSLNHLPPYAIIPRCHTMEVNDPVFCMYHQ